MTDLKTEIIAEIKKKRPRLTDNSIKTYVSLLNTMCKKLDYKKLSDIKAKEVIEYADTIKSIQSKKTLLSSVFILTEDKEINEIMIDLCKQSNKAYQENKVSEKRKDDYLTKEELKQKYDEYLANLKSSPSHEHYINYIIAATMSGVLTGVVRRLEWCDVMVKNYNVETDNYLDMKKKEFVFNKYKTANKYGRQTVHCDAELLKIIKKWLKINTSDYLLIKKNGKKMFSSELSAKLKEMYGCSVDILRSIYISDIYKDIPAFEALQSKAEQFGHSINSAMTFYSKKNIDAK